MSFVLVNLCVLKRVHSHLHPGSVWPLDTCVKQAVSYLNVIPAPCRTNSGRAGLQSGTESVLDLLQGVKKKTAQDVELQREDFLFL